MSTILRTIFNKTTSIILLITAVILLCPAKPVVATGLSVCDVRTAMTSDYDHGAKNSDCSATHSESDSHTLNVLSVYNGLLNLFLVVIAGFVVFNRKLLSLIFENYLTRLRNYQRRYRNQIKPKFEKIFLRWLTLLGGTIAYSS